MLYNNRMKSEKKSGLKFWLAGGLVAIICFGLTLMSGCRSTHSAQPGSVAGRASETPSVTDAMFRSQVLESKSPVLVDFWAPWCGPCRMMSPIVDEFYGENRDKMKVYKLNVDENPGTAQKYQIRGIPSLFLFKNGEVVEQIVGSVSKDRLVETFGKHLTGETTEKPAESSEKPADAEKPQQTR